MTKTSLLVGRNRNIEEDEAEEGESQLLQKGHSYLADYLKPSLPEVKVKAEQKAKRKEKLRRIGKTPLPAEEDAFYQKVLQEKEEAKEKRQERIKAKKEEKKRQADEMFSIAQRNVNYSILKAKGLTRKRKKCDRNPRVKLKRKYEKAVKLRNVLVCCNA
eukprot:TRINITY_DN4836_c0_g3_i5.p1 TRINITY_DN4836_c0_g3~~TRINITY_DN4836_c0_g3_i5.p1  ORF type:complete len:160 (+),score=68.28 TRINITY_DN4836_c0_g3_i5:262-741(+)